MKHMVCVSWTLTDILPDHVIDDLRSVVIRTGENPLFRRIDCLAGDPLVDEAIAMLEAAGAVRHTTGRHMPNEYKLAHRREWEPADADSAEYLWLQVEEPSISIFTENNDPRSFCFEAKDLPRKRSCFGGDGLHVFCPSSVAERLIAAEFAHLQLRPLKLVQRIGNPPVWSRADSHQQWWQLLSDLTLPPFSSSVTKHKLQDGTSVPRDYSGSVSCSEPPFRDFQPTYLRSEWATLPPFDIAMTFEHHINPADLCRWLIVSKRFYQFCKNEGLKADWVPVRFE